MAAFVRWNETTQIWELAVDPTNPTTLFNHLPVANPTLPLDIANKAYVDAAAGAGFVPYNGATANVNLGNNQLQAKNVISWAIGVSTGPTLGSYNNCNLALLEPNATFGLIWGVSSSGDSWVQSQRVDGGNAAYNLLLQPANNAGGTTGKVGIHFRDASISYLYALLDIASGGDVWTTSGWRSGVRNAQVNTLRWGISTYAFGIGQSGDGLYFMISNSEGPSAPTTYQMIISTGAITMPREIAPNVSLIVGSGAGSTTQSAAGIAIDIASGIAQLMVKSSAYGTEMGMLAYSGTTYMGTWSNHGLNVRTNNTDRLVLLADGRSYFVGALGIGNIAPTGGSTLKILGLPTAPGATGDVWIDVPNGHILRWSN